MKKDFVVNIQPYHVNEKLKDIETVSGLSSDKINIKGELAITGFNRIENGLRIRGIYVKLPTDDKIFIPASYHPWIKSDDQDSFPVFIKCESELKWHKDLAAGKFYIMFNRFGEKKLILIKSIYNEKIEYESYTSKYNEDKCEYFVRSVEHELMIVYAKDHKFISLDDITN